MGKLLKLSETEKTVKGKLTALIGEYFALLKHELLVDLYSNHENKVYVTFKDDGIYKSDTPTMHYRRYYKEEFPDFSNKHFNIKTKKNNSILMHKNTLMKDLISFEEAIIFLSAKPITRQRLDDVINIFFNMYPFLKNNKYLVKKKSDLLNIINLYDKLSDDAKEFFKFTDIPYVFSYEINRLTKVLGVAEFAEYLNWDNRKLSSYISKGNVPAPYQKLKATSLWTLGQAEDYKGVIENKKENTEAMRNDWSTRKIIENKIELYKTDDAHYSFAESSVDYSVYLNLNELDLSLEDRILFLELYDDLNGGTLWLKALTLSEYFNDKKWDEVLELGYELIKEYLSFIPEKMKGYLVDDYYDYHSSLYVRIAYVQYLKNNKKESLRLIKEVDDLYYYGVFNVAWGIREDSNKIEEFKKWLEDQLVKESYN